MKYSRHQNRSSFKVPQKTVVLDMFELDMRVSKCLEFFSLNHYICDFPTLESYCTCLHNPQGDENYI